MPYAYKNVYKHVDNVDNLFAKKLFADIYNVSGSHSYQHISLLALVQTEVFNLFKAWEIVSIASFFL